MLIFLGFFANVAINELCNEILQVEAKKIPNITHVSSKYYLALKVFLLCYHQKRSKTAIYGTSTKF